MQPCAGCDAVKKSKRKLTEAQRQALVSVFAYTISAWTQKLFHLRFSRCVASCELVRGRSTALADREKLRRAVLDLVAGRKMRKQKGNGWNSLVLFRSSRSGRASTDWFTIRSPMLEARHTYEVRPRKDHRGVDLISDALPFGRLWYGEPDAVTNA